MAERSRVVILGGGFAGMGVAQELARLLPHRRDCDITLVDQNNFSLFTPMLTEVASGLVEPEGIVAAIRSLEPRVTFEQGCVECIDPAARRVTISVGDGLSGVGPVRRTLEADHLVIALGSVTNFHGIPGLQDHSLTIKSVGDARAIRNRAVGLLERADEESDSGARRSLLTFVVGGGGFSGIETVAALNDLVRDLVDRFPNVRRDDVRTVVVQPGGRILPELSEGLARYTQKELERRGVEVLLNTEVSGAGPDYVEIKEAKGQTSRRIETHTIIWAGGVTPSPAIDTAGLKLGHHHGIVVDSCCRVPGHTDIWALGDCAEIPKPGSSKTYAPTAQNAIREGPLVARNIVAGMRGEPLTPFEYRSIGELAIVGKRTGVASVYGFHFKGLIAWAMWRAIYLAKLPRMPRRIQVGMDWLLDLAFGRDTVEL